MHTEQVNNPQPDESMCSFWNGSNCYVADMRVDMLPIQSVKLSHSISDKLASNSALNVLSWLLYNQLMKGPHTYWAELREKFACSF